MDITAKRFADLLRPYGIRSKQIRFDDGTRKQGYRAESFHAAWKSYAPALPSGVEILLDMCPGSEVVE